MGTVDGISLRRACAIREAWIACCVCWMVLYRRRGTEQRHCVEREREREIREEEKAASLLDSVFVHAFSAVGRVHVHQCLYTTTAVAGGGL